MKDFDLVIVEDTVPRVINRTRAPVALAIFVTMVAVAQVPPAAALLCCQ